MTLEVLRRQKMFHPGFKNVFKTFKGIKEFLKLSKSCDGILEICQTFRPRRKTLSLDLFQKNKKKRPKKASEFVLRWIFEGFKKL